MTTIDVNAAPTGAALSMPVGRPASPSGSYLLHVVDGDGASLCESVDAENLVQVHALRWYEVPTSRRCCACQTILWLHAAPRS
jgi:hypothetical protein